MFRIVWGVCNTVESIFVLDCFALQLIRAWAGKLRPYGKILLNNVIYENYIYWDGIARVLNIKNELNSCIKMTFEFLQT